MAIFDRTMPCNICCKPLGESDVVAFPRFVANPKDPIVVFDDSVVHRICLDAHPLAARAWLVKDVLERINLYSNGRCVVCGSDIEDPAESFRAGFLTSDPASPIFEFNYMIVHRAHFDRWTRAEEFRTRMQEVMASDAWSGPQLVFDPAPRWLDHHDDPAHSTARRQIVAVRRPTPR